MIYKSPRHRSCLLCGGFKFAPGERRADAREAETIRPISARSRSPAWPEMSIESSRARASSTSNAGGMSGCAPNERDLHDLGRVG